MFRYSIESEYIYGGKVTKNFFDVIMANGSVYDVLILFIPTSSVPQVQKEANRSLCDLYELENKLDQ